MLLSLICIFLFSQCRNVESEKHPNLVFVLIDCWRFDHFNSEITPHLYQFSKKGAIFAQYYVNAGSTRSSIASIFSSQLPEYMKHDKHENGMGRFGTKYNERGLEMFPHSLLTLPQILKNNGYSTICVTANPNSGSDGGYGDKDWTRLEEFFSKSDENNTGDAKTLIYEGIRQMRTISPQKPFFLFLHLMDAHFIYNRPNLEKDELAVVKTYYDTRSENPVSRSTDLVKPAALAYKDALTYIDSYLQVLLSELDPSETVVIVTADHGELFNEHQLISHLGHLPEEIVHVPLIIAGPGVVQKRSMNDLYQGVDLLPTVLSLAGVKASVRTGGSDIFLPEYKPLKIITACSHLENAFISEKGVERIPIKRNLSNGDIARELKALGYLN
jgi:arylsulfatase A-like enzyme